MDANKKDFSNSLRIPPATISTCAASTLDEMSTDKLSAEDGSNVAPQPPPGAVVMVPASSGAVVVVDEDETVISTKGILWCGYIYIVSAVVSVCV